MIRDRWADNVAFLVVDVVSKNAESGKASSSRRCVSGVTTSEGSGIHGNVGSDRASNTGPSTVDGTGDSCSTPPPFVPIDAPEAVDWANLTILPDDDDFAQAAADEETMYEAMGFEAADERVEEAEREAVPIPTMTAEMIA